MSVHKMHDNHECKVADRKTSKPFSVKRKFLTVNRTLGGKRGLR